MNDRMDSQHFATSADVERTRAELIERIERTENRVLRWIAGLFVAQTLVLVGAVLGMIEVLR